MDKRFTVFSFLSRSFMLYGIGTLLLNVLSLLFGESAQDYSTLFAVPGAVSIATSFQYFAAIIVIHLLRLIFMTDRVIKKMPLTARIISMFACIFAVIVGFVIVFGWFPVDEPLAWVMFLISMTVSCIISTLISSYAEKQENRRLADALERVKGAQSHE